MDGHEIAKAIRIAGMEDPPKKDENHLGFSKLESTYISELEQTVDKLMQDLPVCGHSVGSNTGGLGCDECLLDDEKDQHGFWSNQCLTTICKNTTTATTTLGSSSSSLGTFSKNLWDDLSDAAMLFYPKHADAADLETAEAEHIAG